MALVLTAHTVSHGAFTAPALMRNKSALPEEPENASWRDFILLEFFCLSGNKKGESVALSREQ